MIKHIFKPKSKWEIFIIRVRIFPNEIRKKILRLWYNWKYKSFHPHTISSNLVPVQPMQGPTGILYYIDYTYEDLPGK